MISKKMDTRLNILGAFSFVIIILILSYASSKATNDYSTVHSRAWSRYPGIRYPEKSRFIKGTPMPIYAAEKRAFPGY